MKLFFISLFIGLSIVLLVKDHPGYVLINYPPWVMETALPIFVVMMIIVYFVVNYLVRIIGTFLFVRRIWGSWQKRRLGLRAQAALAHGLMNNWAGRWSAAEKLLTRSAQYSAYPALHLIAAAHAAHQQSRFAKRDRYLDIAKKHVAEKDISIIEYNQAEMYVDCGEIERAIPLLEHIQKQAPKNPRVARLLAQCFKKQNNWERLSLQIRHMRDHKLINKADYYDIEVNVYYELIIHEYHKQDHSAIASLWRRVPMHMRQHELILPFYIRSLNANDQGVQAELLLYKAIKNNLNDTFIELYGLTVGAKLNKQLSNVEQWLKSHPQNPVLLHAAARLCLANQLWGKARSYLEASIGITPTQECYKELGDLLEYMGDVQASIDCYRRGLILAVTNSMVTDKLVKSGSKNGVLPMVSQRNTGYESETNSLPKPQSEAVLTDSSDS